MVFDFGGSYLEISILTNNNRDSKYTVEFTRVLLNHGGRAITEKIVEFCIELLENANDELPEAAKQRIRKELYAPCDYAKCFLSTHDTTSIKKSLEDG